MWHNLVLKNCEETGQEQDKGRSDRPRNYNRITEPGSTVLKKQEENPGKT